LEDYTIFREIINTMLSNVLIKILNISRHSINLMDHKISLATISLAVVSMVLALPSLINQPVEAAAHWCEHQGQKPNWVTGCKNGWWDCDHDGYNPDGRGSDYKKGYERGWKKGGCK
jgi:hypothetical protein